MRGLLWNLLTWTGILMLPACSDDASATFNQTDELGRKQGSWEFFDEDDNLEALRMYRDGFRCGKEVLYYANGDVHARNHWQCDSLAEYLDSLCVIYYPSGQVHLESWYDWGEPVGEWRYYFEDGTLRTRQFYGDGMRQGIWEFYHPNGAIDFTLDYRQADVKWTDETQTGIYVYFDGNGDTARVELWMGGQRIE